MLMVIDRIEDGICICEILEGSDMEKQVKIAASDLPQGAKEGDVLHKEDEKLIIDLEATRLRTEQIKAMMSSIFK